jgi:hypothetical protein
MTEVEKMLNNEMLACEGMIFIHMFDIVLMTKQKPEEFVKIANESESGMVEFKIAIPSKLKDLLEEVRMKTLKDYLEIKFDSSKMNADRKAEAFRVFEEISKTWMESSFGMNFVTGLIKSLAELSNDDPEEVISRMTNYSATARSLSSTISELKG